MRATLADSSAERRNSLILLDLFRLTGRAAQMA
jgi:hypothetical protein